MKQISKRSAIKYYAGALEIGKDLKRFGTENEDLDSFSVLKNWRCILKPLKSKNQYALAKNVYSYYLYRVLD